MGRPLRVEYEGAWYHVSSAGISHLPLFKTDFHREVFFELLDDINLTFGIEIHAYVLMEDTYELLVRTPFANLSKAMQHLNSNYSQKYNRHLRRRGPLFCGRFRSILLNADMYLLQVSRYLHWLPAIKKLSTIPETYNWSSCQAYLSITPSPKWLTRSQVLSRFGHQDTLEKHKKYLNLGVDSEISNFYAQKNAGPVLGPKSFKKKVLELVPSETSSSDVPDIKNLKTRPSISGIVECVDNNSAKKHFELKICEHKLSRNLAIALCREIGGYSLKEIAEAFGINHHRSVSVIINRTKKKIFSDVVLHHYYSSLKNEVLVNT